MLLVSHDRTFLNNVVTQVFAFEGEGHVQAYAGGYDDWLQQRPTANAPGGGAGAESKRDVAVSPSARPTARRTKMSFSEVRELESLPGKIAALEKEQAALQSQLSDPALYAQSPQLVTSLGMRANAIGVELEAILERWETLEAKKPESGG